MSRVSCVTGGTGFVATELIKQLLDKGCTVHTTVRCVEDVENPALSKLKSLSQALPGTLFFHKADLLSEGDFDEVVSACDVVYHTASPFGFFDSPDPQKDLIDPAVKGTINVLQSVVKNKESVKRVVLTSSVAAVHGEYASPPKSGDLYTEEDWNETSSLGNKQAYHLSKVLAEREAWRMAKEEGLDLVTVCPNFIIGPLTSPRADGVSVGFFKGLLETAAPDKSLTFCDVRDVARAHILAAEEPKAAGRYIVSQRRATAPAELHGFLADAFPDLHFPAPTAETHEVTDKIDNAKAARELGLVLSPLRSTVVDMARTMIALGVAKPVKAAKRQKTGN
uniref:Flavanone 4-reductase n=1 Tax=Tetraselmis sp. GSL018 TaxID=582737 RepID=A0A061REF8_9CHLO|mmetsp:Transcript_23300/g.55767  ORF Transcript_23300/g.55767 Transcript_23300/m.55767 type:complete len:337 (+) Transcript_23300:171-1181(+)|eukprot:CAMPEP_0177585172 /NCGR_PEP_ID=MMETSP0419_2-20121207/4323_1 /TAXON_ID=582737 /ORGANISM="Tetraselmis sp., Strain GSL018" /LENGTH=336 /DNA_ID=CAMNT_0019074831 /DNA_START=142 /DNA_END=1152 /DNA_ORIENTATION=+